MAEIKENQATLQSNTQAPTVSAGEPAQTAVESVTVKVKDPKKVADGRAGAAARKAKQERLLEQLRATKKSFRPGEASIPPKEADSKDQELRSNGRDADKRPEHNGLTNWTPWITGACLTGGAALALFLPRLRDCQAMMRRSNSFKPRMSHGQRSGQSARIGSARSSADKATP